MYYLLWVITLKYLGYIYKYATFPNLQLDYFDYIILMEYLTNEVDRSVSLSQNKQNSILIALYNKCITVEVKESN